MKIASYNATMRIVFVPRLIKAQRGFTLINLVVAISIMLISLAVGIPAYNRTIKPTAELNGAARQLFSDIQLARLQAVSENIRIGFDFDSTPDDYIVFRDMDSNSQYSAGDDIVKRVQFAAGLGYGNVSFDTSQGGGDGVSFNTGTFENSFSFSSRGLPWPNGTVFLRNQKNPAEGRKVLVNTMGGVNVEEYNP
jgi:Tfp pilus assembly protein FimT